MGCVACGSAAVTERSERTAQGYRRFRCRTCGKQFNERSGTVLNHAQYPSDVIALVVLWRLRSRLTLRDLAEMFLLRGIVFSYEAVREWEAKLAPLLADELRQRRHGKSGACGRRWHVDETYLKLVAGGLTCIGRSTATAISWTPCSASTATWRRPKPSSAQPRRSRAWHPTRSPPTATAPIRGRSARRWGVTSCTGPARTRITDWSKTTGA